MRKIKEINQLTTLQIAFTLQSRRKPNHSIIFPIRMIHREIFTPILRVCGKALLPKLSPTCELTELNTPWNEEIRIPMCNIPVVEGDLPRPFETSFDQIFQNLTMNEPGIIPFFISIAAALQRNLIQPKRLRRV